MYDGFVVLPLGCALGRDWCLTAAGSQGGAWQVESCQHVEMFVFKHMAMKAAQHWSRAAACLLLWVADLVLVVVCHSTGAQQARSPAI